MEQNREQYNPQEALVEKSEKLTQEALNLVEARYGSGYPDDLTEPLVAPLAYHNVQHSKRVSNAAGALAQKHGLSAYDIQLAQMIAAAHDVIHEDTSEQSAEQQSADWLVRRMQAEGFPPEDQIAADYAIRGTLPLRDTNNAFMGQAFTPLCFPNERAGEIALCVAAADMEAVFQHYGPYEAHNLYKERLGISYKHSPPSLDGLVTFQQEQIAFLFQFQTLYPQLETFFGGLRIPVIQHHRALLDKITTGEITTWGEVMELDQQFYMTWRPTAS